MPCRYDETSWPPTHLGEPLGPGFFRDEREDGATVYCAHTDPEGHTTAKVVTTVAAAEPSEAEPAKRRRRDG